MKIYWLVALLAVMGCSGNAQTTGCEDLPDTAQITCLMNAITAAKPVPVHAFFDKTNLAAFSDDFLMRGLDAQSTRSFETNRCACLHETQIPSFLAKSTPAMYSYSLGVAGGGIGLAFLAHHLGHHRIERWIPRVDIGQETYWVIHNRRQIQLANERFR
jgi:hypothetical protein